MVGSWVLGCVEALVDLPMGYDVDEEDEGELGSRKGEDKKDQFIPMRFTLRPRKTN